jgi:hypothetical protein
MGVLYSQSRDEAAAWQILIATAAQCTPPGSLTFAYPYAPAVYTLTGTRNATRIDWALPQVHSAAQFQAAADAVQNSDVRCIYYLPLSPQVFKDNPYFDPAAYSQEFDALNALLTRGFKPAGRAGYAEVYQRAP